MSALTSGRVDLDRLKHEADLLDLIRRDVVLTPKVRNRPLGEHYGPCPFCRGGEDRFIVWPTAKADGTPPKWMCRRCTPDGGSVIDYVMRREGLSFSDAVAWLDDGRSTVALPASERLAPARAVATIEAELEQAERLADYWRRRADGLQAELAAHPDVLGQLAAGGIGEMAVRHFDFGYTTHQSARSLVIPWRYHHGGREIVKGVQFRSLFGDVFDEGDPRYRWQYGSDGKSLFNADAVLRPDDNIVIVVEGAKKAAALWSHGMTSVVGIASKTCWDGSWAGRFNAFERVIFALDPDADEAAVAAARTFTAGAYVASLPMKPDDLLVATGGNVGVLWGYLESARKVD